MVLVILRAAWLIGRDVAEHYVKPLALAGIALSELFALPTLLPRVPSEPFFWLWLASMISTVIYHAHAWGEHIPDCQLLEGR
ncbi:MAG TPA: hypothetical protein PKA49_12140 [Tepidiformaceae bacterium]|nr:hypothetical protein [Tepidiformaceae bacterium]